MNAMQNLIERLEKLTGPDRELDHEVPPILGWTRQSPGNPKWPLWKNTEGLYVGASPKFTESVDAALTLVPEGYRTMHAGQSADGKWFWGLHMDAGHPSNPTTKDGVSWAHQTENRPDLFADGSPTPAIAVCIAALKTRVQAR